MSRTRRRGFTMVELLIVLALMSAIAVIAFPRGSQVLARKAVRSAKLKVQSTLALARAAAIQNGRPARFIRTGSAVQAYLEVGGGLTAVGAPVDLTADKVTVSTSPDTIRFDERGFAWGISPSNAYQVIRLTRGAASDSVCVSRFGRIMYQGVCQ